jgi:oligosaccharide repeat unit polymerase
MNTLSLQGAGSVRSARLGSDDRIHPCLFTVPVATTIAILLLPRDASVQGALMLPSWTMTVGLLGGIAIDALERGIDRIFRAENVLMIALVTIVYPELLQPVYSTYLDAASIQNAFIAIGIFATMIALGASIGSRSLSRAVVELAQRQLSRKSVFRLMLLCWALAMFNFALASNFSLTNIIDGLLAGRWSAPWARGQFGGWESFRDFLNNFGYLVPTLTSVLALQSGSWLNPMVLAGLLCSAVDIAFIVQSGSRRLVVVVIGAAILTWLCAKRRELRLKHCVIVALLVLANAVFSDVMLNLRNEGFRGFSIEKENFTALKVDDNFRALAETMRLIPTEAPFVGFHFMWFVVVRPIPRVFWPGKPTGPGFDLTQYLGEKGLTHNVSVIGEFYMSFGWAGIVIGGAVFGWFARHWSQLLERDFGITATALYGLGTMALFLGIRSLLEVILMMYPIICWLALDRFLSKKDLRAANPNQRRTVAHELA